MNQNKSALDRLKEIEAEREEIQNALIAEKENVEFPLYTKKGTVLSKHFSKNKAIDIKTDGCYVYIQLYDWSTYATTCWGDYINGKTEPITREEFEAARAEAINKISNL